MEFKIEDNVPYNPGRRMAWPFHKMQVKDSFVLPSEDNTGEIERKCRVAAASYASRKNSQHKADPNYRPIMFSVRCQDDGSVRCWRLA